MIVEDDPRQSFPIISDQIWNHSIQSITHTVRLTTKLVSSLHHIVMMPALFNDAFNNKKAQPVGRAFATDRLLKPPDTGSASTANSLQNYFAK